MTEAYPPRMTNPVASLNRSSLFVLIACAVAVGVLMAAGVIWAVHTKIHSGDKDECYRDNVTRSITGEPSRDCG